GFAAEEVRPGGTAAAARHEEPQRHGRDHVSGKDGQVDGVQANGTVHEVRPSVVTAGSSWPRCLRLVRPLTPRPIPGPTTARSPARRSGECRSPPAPARQYVQVPATLG